MGQQADNKSHRERKLQPSINLAFKMATYFKTTIEEIFTP
jgi:DNA-binding XRE family transcriptional regulator